MLVLPTHETGTVEPSPMVMDGNRREGWREESVQLDADI